jgi:hypothetical protein
MYEEIEQFGQELWKDMRSRDVRLLDDPYNSEKLWRRIPEEIHDVCRF